VQSRYFPTSWEIRRVKIYSEDEITLSKGMKKKCNVMAKKLCCETNMSREDTGKEIHARWREHQGTLAPRRFKNESWRYFIGFSSYGA
jgi:hypothetical protein